MEQIFFYDLPDRDFFVRATLDYAIQLNDSGMVKFILSAREMKSVPLLRVEKPAVSKCAGTTYMINQVIKHKRQIQELLRKCSEDIVDVILVHLPFVPTASNFSI